MSKKQIELAKDFDNFQHDIYIGQYTNRKTREGLTKKVYKNKWHSNWAQTDDARAINFLAKEIKNNWNDFLHRVIVLNNKMEVIELWLNTVYNENYDVLVFDVYNKAGELLRIEQLDLDPEEVENAYND